MNYKGFTIDKQCTIFSPDNQPLASQVTLAGSNNFHFCRMRGCPPIELKSDGYTSYEEALKHVADQHIKLSCPTT